MKRAGNRIVSALAIALVVLVGGCGGDDSASPPPKGPLAEALADIGGSGADASMGVGWADPQLVTQEGGEPDLVAKALGPNAGSVIDAARPLRRRFGLDPLSAERLISVGGSYAFGLRVDGLDGRRLRRALVADGGRTRQAGSLDLLSVGDYAVVPEPLLGAGVHGLGAFDAFGDHVIVLAISDRARAALLGNGHPLLDEPTYAAAADCLGDVVVARMIPDKLLISAEQGVDLVALGVGADHEVLCVLGGTEERADEVASALENSLSPDARDPSTGRSVGEAVAAADVGRSSYDGVQVVRVEVTRARGQAPGYVFEAASRGSLVGMINASRRTINPD